MKEYVCPLCKNNLQQQKTRLWCGRCGKKFSFTENIPVFTQSTHTYKRTASNHEKRYNHLIKEAKEKGWFHALVETYPDESNGIVNYAVNRKRSDFLILLPLHNRATVLDFGCGLGPITHALAPNVKKVYAIDSHMEQVQFAKIRLSQGGHKNVEFACGGDDCRLPYRDNFFDIVILNAVLQWVGLSHPKQNPAVAQKKILSEIRRVLKNKGVLYLSVPNRFALDYLLGKPDEHSFGIRFTTLFPYCISNFFVRVKTGNSYSGRCYSYFEYRRLLQESGFSDISFYGILPSWRDPQAIVPLENLTKYGKFVKKVLRKFHTKRDPMYLVTKILPINLVKCFVYHYGIVCRRR